MKEYQRIVYKVKAFQYNGGDIQNIENVFMSEKPKYTNTWQDRFINEPPIPKPYILVDNVREYINNGNWLLTKNNGISYFILTNEEFLENF